MRAGWIGTWSDSSSGWYFAYHSRQIACASAIHALRFAALVAIRRLEHRGQRHLGVAVQRRDASG